MLRGHVRQQQIVLRAVVKLHEHIPDGTGQKNDDSSMRASETGYIKVEAGGAEAKADVASDLKVDLALRRRSLALEMADLLPWE